jgi:hypothetical protein
MLITPALTGVAVLTEVDSARRRAAGAAKASARSSSVAIGAFGQLIEARVAVDSAQASVTALDLPAVTERPGVIFEKQPVAQRA